jgi:hypothetical protein
MAGQALRDDLIEAGGRLLRVADEAAIRPVAAAWLYDHALGDWRYYLATELVDIVGRRSVFAALAYEFSKVKAPEDFSIVDVYIASPKDPVFSVIASIFLVKGNHVIILQDVRIDDTRFDAVIYRFDKETLGENADDCLSTTFRLAS